MARHKHADVIHAYAEGDEIEVYDERIGWDTVPWPSFDPSLKYRVKPKIVKKEGWIALYENGYNGFPACCGIYGSASQAREICGVTPQIVRIEWEEEL